MLPYVHLTIIISGFRKLTYQPLATVLTSSPQAPAPPAS